MLKPTLRSQHRSFGGTVGFYNHRSEVCNCEMGFTVFIPPQAATQKVPGLLFLSGLTCTEENFITKAGAIGHASKYGMMLIAPDTSPRGNNVPDRVDATDLGMGASFYLNATETPWSQHYQMYSYITQELIEILTKHFPLNSDAIGIMGHSMGGHGALVCGLRNPQLFRSVSAFAPIAAPSQCQWGQNAFSHYLGTDRATWKPYDASELVKSLADSNRPILIDQGTADPFLKKGQLLPEVFAQECQAAGQPLILRMQEGYDHGYFFISSFIEDHIGHHAKFISPS